MKKKVNNSYSAAALLLGISVEHLEKLMEAEKDLSVALHEKRQLADMYNKLLAENEKLENEFHKFKQLVK